MKAPFGRSLVPDDLGGMTLAVVGGSLGALLGSTVARILAARMLTLADFGVLLTAVGGASVFGGILSLGLNPASARRIAALREGTSPEATHSTATTALKIATLSGGSGLLGLIVLGTALNHFAAMLPVSWQLLGRTLLGVSPIALALPIGMAVLGVCRGFGEVRGRAVFRDGFGGLLRAGLVGLAGLIGGGTTLFAFAFGLSSLGTEGIFLIYGRWRGWFGNFWSWDGKLLKSLAPFCALEILGQVQAWLDLAIVALLGNPVQVGYFGIARGLVRATRMLAGAASHGYLPLASAAHQRNDSESLGIAYGRSRLLSLALIWIPLAIFLLSPSELLILLAGEAYAPAAPILRILALALLIDVLPGYLGPTLEATGHAAIQARIRVLSLGVGLIAMLLLTQLDGARGTALGLLLMALVRNLLLGISLWKLLTPNRASLRPGPVAPTAILLLASGAACRLILPGLPPLLIAIATGVPGAILLWLNPTARRTG